MSLKKLSRNAVFPRKRFLSSNSTFLSSKKTADVCNTCKHLSAHVSSCVHRCGCRMGLSFRGGLYTYPKHTLPPCTLLRPAYIRALKHLCWVVYPMSISKQEGRGYTGYACGGGGSNNSSSQHTIHPIVNNAFRSFSFFYNSFHNLMYKDRSMFYVKLVFCVRRRTFIILRKKSISYAYIYILYIYYYIGGG